jgi:hypothetical protein
MRRRVFVVAAEYSANPRYLSPERRRRDWLAEPHPELSDPEVTRLFFRFPSRRDDGRAKAEDWRRDFGLESPIGLTDLFTSAAHRALTSLNRLVGGDYEKTRGAITDLYITSMPGLDPSERMNIGLVPQELRELLALPRSVIAQYVVGTSDAGAWAFAQAVRTARHMDPPATILVVAGQILPSGYASQYQIRSVLGEDDQARGLDMLAVGDLLMDLFRRNLGLSRDEVHRFLARVAASKFQAGEQYPAAIEARRTIRRDEPRTPYFDASDIAVPCCGAAATIITSNEELVERLVAARGPRYQAPPITEVLGIGEGSSNANLLHRRSPLYFATAVREAFASTADDAGLPLSTFKSCAFGVTHDAFPSIELAFLLGMGLSWERSAERMAEGWSNPFGGLLCFGHALGASGLVQVNKAHHLFCGDRRYIRETGGPGARGSSPVSYVTSVGGPLSHTVVALFRGGLDNLSSIAQRAHPGSPDSSQSTQEWRAKRRQLRRVLPSFWAQLHKRLGTEAWLVEGTTYVSIRSALRALSNEDVSRLTFDGLEQLVAVEHLEPVRAQLREVVRVVIEEADRVESMFDAFRLLSDEVTALCQTWRAAGWLTQRAEALPEAKLATRVKDCLRVPLALLYGPCVSPNERRRVLFLPSHDLTYYGLQDVNVLVSAADGSLTPAQEDSSLLPFWNARATRLSAELAGPGPASPEVVDQVLAEESRSENTAELELLRWWFSADPPAPTLERSPEAQPSGRAQTYT